jgi:hypothetical protein
VRNSPVNQERFKAISTIFDKLKIKMGIARSRMDTGSWHGVPETAIPKRFLAMS